MRRFGIILLFCLFSLVGFSQKFFSWPLYETNSSADNRICSDTIYLKDTRPLLNYSKFNCSIQDLLNSVEIGLINSGVTNFCVLPLKEEVSKTANYFLLEISMFYSYLNFNIWDSRVDMQLLQSINSEIRKFEFITKSSSERNNWGHKSGQKALRISFDAALTQLVQQIKMVQ